MNPSSIKLFPTLSVFIDRAKSLSISNERKEILSHLIEYIQTKVANNQAVNLNFICTHNSRRSQFSQIWAKTASEFYHINTNCYSGGVEVTAFNERAVASIERAGFKVEKEGSTNPKYLIKFNETAEPIIAFSKLFDDPQNEAEKFAAIMTCSHADENCPFIPGTEQRIPVRYFDPKQFDDTEEEAAKYDERSLQIASEMFYVFSNIKN